MNYIKRISVYSYTNQLMLNSGDRSLIKMPRSLMDSYLNSLEHKIYSIWTEPGDVDLFGEESDSIVLTEFIFETFNKPQGFVQVEIRNENFAKAIHEMNIRKTGYVFVTNDKGNIILSGNNSISEIIPANLIAEYADKPEGYDIVKGSNGRRFLISYITSRYNRWKYMALLPADELEDNSKMIGIIIAVLCSLFIVISVFVSYTASNDIYNPISLLESSLKDEPSAKEGINVEKLKNRQDELGRINREISKIIDQLSTEKTQNTVISEQNNALKKQLDDNIADLKRYFLYRLIHGDITNKSDMARQANFLGIELKESYVVLMLEFDKHFNKMMEGIDEREKSKIRNGVIGVIDKAMANVEIPSIVFYETNDCVDKIIAIADLNNSKSEIENIHNIKLMCNFIQNILFNDFKYTASISIGKIYKGLDNIQNSYKDAIDASKYRFVLGNKAIILKSELDEEMALKPKEHKYKRHLRNCLNSRSLNQTYKVLQEFKDNIKNVVSPEINYEFHCRSLINGILEYLNEINYPFSEDKNELNDVFINFEKKFDNIEEAVNWLYEYIQKVFIKIDSHTPQRNKFVEESLKIISNEYYKDISLTNISDRLGVSEPYFSKIFKDEMGKNFKEYLTEFKLSKAKEMLRNTNSPIYEIAGLVGYNNHTQFAKMFKKYEGITPQEYRNMT